MMELVRKCRICKGIVAGRADKAFCGIACKNSYHTGLGKHTRKAAHAIDRHLHRNRSILLEVQTKNHENVKVSRRILEEKRFHWKYHTHYHINSQGKMMHYVYHMGWMDFSDDEVLVVRAQRTPSA